MAIELVSIDGFTGCTNFTPNAWNYQREERSPFYTEGTNLYSLAEIGETVTIIDNDYMRLEYTRQNSSTNSIQAWYKSPQGLVSICSITSGWDPSSFFGLAFGIDESNQTGGFFSIMQYTYYGSEVYYIGSNSINQGTNTAYLAIKNSLPSLYNWQSVQSISGKNKTVSLTTLKEESINDGSPVDDATASAFNNAPNSCSVGGIVSVDLPIVDDNPLSIAVKYNIPELTDSVYTSCKVVAKKNKIPKSKTDGDKILDVSPSSHSCVIKGLEQETKYYVVVFVEDSFGNKAESEPGGPVRTGKKSVGIFFETLISARASQDKDFKETITVTRV